VAVPHVVEPILSAFRQRHSRIDVEVVAEDRFVDIVSEGYDAGIRLTEAIERDMVQVRLTKGFRFVVVASPAYLERNGTPQRPEELLRHECLTFRSPSSGALYAWELERGRRNWRVAVRGGVVTNDSRLRLSLAEQGAGLTYVFEPMASSALRAGRLRCVLEPYAAKVPGFFLYYPSRSQTSPALRLFVEVAKSISIESAS
jgi:DNA-binding transcriptional LysR family regulator